MSANTVGCLSAKQTANFKKSGNFKLVMVPIQFFGMNP